MTEYSKLPYYGTTVSVIKTQSQIKKLLNKYGLQAIKLIEDSFHKKGVIEFILSQNSIPIQFRFSFNLPEKEMHIRQVYRGLFYYLKARFTSVDFGINTVEKEFMAEIVMVLPDGTCGTMKELYGDKILELKSNNLLPFKDEPKL